MPYLFLACSISLCLVFGVSASGKVGRSAFRDFVTSAGPLKVLPRPFRSAAALAVLVVELALTVTLFAGMAVTARPALAPVAAVVFAAAAALLLAFTVAIAMMLRRGEREGCRCFGAKATPLGPAHLIRNALLLAVALAGLLAVGDLEASIEPAGAVLACAAGLVAGLLVTRFDDLTDLFRTPETSARGR